ncbi:MAG TPA: hypothetical protein VFW79_14845 [Cellulomonas sp.]|uniref:hypothetical protein n=1 Tax=Cellulomonas sp. TaxID=40001 RepID=UPI002E339104|nr:hypothetical protein [Cellulomonas sp.]HEX5333916.1 hypothetical protein [Cellulomonas sp.]
MSAARRSRSVLVHGFAVDSPRRHDEQCAWFDLGAEPAGRPFHVPVQAHHDMEAGVGGGKGVVVL